MERLANGVVVPMPTFPVLKTEKSVWLVDEAIAKSVEVVAEAVVVEMESCAYGVVVPIPMTEVVADCVPPPAWVKAS